LLRAALRVDLVELRLSLRSQFLALELHLLGELRAALAVVRPRDAFARFRLALLLLELRELHLAAER
jgi:hypothetical protein